MTENQKIVQQLLQEYELDADPTVKQAILDFSIMYAQKFIRKCIDVNGKKINLAAVRNTYELINKVHSPEYQQELAEKRQKMIRKINQDKIEELPQIANTVKLHFKNKIESMRTNNQYQIIFDTNTP